MSTYSSPVALGQEFRTGQAAPVSGVYEYVRHIDSSACIPTWEERRIPLTKGETFPPHKSCKKGVIWKLVMRS